MRPLIVIMGPTASGKSGIAMEAAVRFGGEIITADSMQLYRGLDIGTAKPTPEDRRRVPHHLLDVLDISERSDLFTYRNAAERSIGEIRAGNALPILAGGTGLYLRALLYGLDNMPADQTLRAELDAEFDHPEGEKKLREFMQKNDPGDFERWKDHRRKLIRACEVFRLTGQSMTGLQKTWPKAVQRPDARSFVLHWQRDALKERIARRCAEMLRGGWIEETVRMEKKGLFEAPTAWQALGYPIIRDFLHGRLPENELEERISTATWQYARRQMTWFRGQHPEAEIIELPAETEAVLERIGRRIREYSEC